MTFFQSFNLLDIFVVSFNWGNISPRPFHNVAVDIDGHRQVDDDENDENDDDEGDGDEKSFTCPDIELKAIFNKTG